MSKNLVLTTDDLGTWEPVVDLARWQRSGVLSLIYQSTNPPVTGAGNVISVLEF